eukprot:SAG31_NODE_3317_length_4424_cov_3.662197_6_plen_94_part_00
MCRCLLTSGDVKLVEKLCPQHRLNGTESVTRPRAAEAGGRRGGPRAARIPYFDNFNVADLFILKKLVQYRAMESGIVHLPSTVLCTDRSQSQP